MVVWTTVTYDTSNTDTMTAWVNGCDERCPTGCNKKSDHEFRRFNYIRARPVNLDQPVILRPRWPVIVPIDTRREAVPAMTGYSRIEDRVRQHLGRLHQRL